MIRFVFLSLLAFAFTATAADRPNIVFILVDDMGYGDIGCMGCKDIATPNIDRIAKEGVLMTDFYSNAPVCTPTRAGFMLGRWQQRVGIDEKSERRVRAGTGRAWAGPAAE